MAQGFSYENSTNGQGEGALKLGDHSFSVSQRMILLGNSLLTRNGLVQKEIAGFPPLIIEGAKRMNAIINNKSVDSGADPSINAFWFESGKGRPDFIFLKIPMHTGNTVSNALVMLYSEEGSGQRFMQALQDESMNQSMIQTLLSKILQINNAQQVNASQIISDNLVIYPSSVLELAGKTTEKNDDLKLLYDQNQANIIVRKIPAQQILGTPLTTLVPPPKANMGESISSDVATKQPVDTEPEMTAIKMTKYGPTFRQNGLNDKPFSDDIIQKAAQVGYWYYTIFVTVGGLPNLGKLTGYQTLVLGDVFFHRIKEIQAGNKQLTSSQVIGYFKTPKGITELQGIAAQALKQEQQFSPEERQSIDALLKAIEAPPSP